MKKWLNHPVVSKIHDIIREKAVKGNVLSVGSSPQEKDVLNLPYFKDNKESVNLVGINIAGSFGKFGGFNIIKANGHDMPFQDNHFSLVICNAMIEHDPEFWKTIGEVNRVLAHGGLFIVNAPGYTQDKTDVVDATLTYKIHGSDYYRFSKASFREVIFKDMQDVKVVDVMVPPRIIGWGFKA